jgi:hypothetical protein
MAYLSKSDHNTVIMLLPDLGIPEDNHEVIFVGSAGNFTWWYCISCAYSTELHSNALAHIIKNQFKAS